MKEKLELILKAIYWNKFNPKQKKMITEIISEEGDSMMKANEICDLLGIERRSNRQAIYNILNT